MLFFNRTRRSYIKGISIICLLMPLGLQAEDKFALTHAYENLSNDEFDRFILGKSFFTIPWVQAPSATTARDGLGPLFNANTCVSCHAGNGAGFSENKKGKLHRSLVFKLSQPTQDKIKSTYEKTFGFKAEPVYGAQLNINAIHGVSFEGTAQVSYTQHRIKYPDGQTVTLRKPVFSLANLNYGSLNKASIVSARLTLPLIGLGEIEKISQQDILSREDKNDRDQNGISGKANYVYSFITKDYRLGRFLWKASSPSVKQQVASALHNDMGLSSPLFPNENCTDVQNECLQAARGKGKEIDVPMHRLDAINFYMTHLKIPKQRQAKKHIQGRKLFNQVGCNLCHAATFTTKENNRVHPYSDFLLHDMGKGLSDNRTEFLANAQEWRTQPLWGIGLKKILNKNPGYLHDGRAQTLEEAILWHGGEASTVINKFKQLNQLNRQQIINFLRSL